MTDILIVGAGPAGMAAAITASRNGASVTLIDNRPEPGGNIYSSLQSTREQRPKMWRSLGSGYRAGQQIIDAFVDAEVDYLPSHALWHLDPDGSASVRGPEGVKSFNSQKVILATGAQERPMPLKGWTLPGVMGVGAAQILLKASGVVPSGPLVIVGQGPLPLLYASQVLAVGGEIGAFIEPKLSKDTLQSVRHLVGAWHGRSYLFKGMGYLLQRMLARIPVYRNAHDIQIIGTQNVSGVSFETNKVHTLNARSVLIHDGVVPTVNPGGAAGLVLTRDNIQDCWVANSSEIIKVAGDAGGILGAKAAELTGQAAVYEILGEEIPDQIQRELQAERQFRSFIDTVYPTIGNAALADDDTIICRCEAVSKQRILDAIPNSGTDPNRLKTSIRCGMGPCQGRMCALSVEAIINEATGADKQSIGLHHLRNPIVPITIGNLASAKADE